MSKKDIEFTTEKRKVSDLIDCDYNPRVLTKKQFQELSQSFKKFGYVEICAINLDNVIIAGHQRIHVMKDLGWNDKEIDVRVPNRQLNKKEFDEYLVRSNKNGGAFDFDMLANSFEIDELIEWGFDIAEFGIDIEEDVKDISDDIKTEYKIEVTCVDECAQETLYDSLKSEGYSCRILTL